MIHFCCNSTSSSPQDHVPIRHFIFIISGVCVGFPALLWACAVLVRQHNSGAQVSFIAIFLLLSDLLELILSPVYLITFFKRDHTTCLAFHLLFVARLCGHQFHQLAVLESILSQKSPSLAQVFSTPCSIILSIGVWMTGIWSVLISSKITNLIIKFLCALPVVVCAFTYLVTRNVSPENNQATDHKSGALVLGVAVFTLIILYLPFFLPVFIHMPFMLDSLVSMRLFSEPILFVLICLAEQHI